MNPVELRYEVSVSMTGLLNNPHGVKSFTRVPPVPGEPLAIDVITADPPNGPDARRYYRITIEEVDADT